MANFKSASSSAKKIYIHYIIKSVLKWLQVLLNIIAMANKSQDVNYMSQTAAILHNIAMIEFSSECFLCQVYYYDE